jgi:hypothetical protein
MPVKLTTTVVKILTVPNPTNTALVREFYQYMQDNGASERNQNNSFYHFSGRALLVQLLLLYNVY